MHQRKVIRNAVLAALVGSTAAGDKVYASRVNRENLRDLPIIHIYTLEDDVEEDSRNTAPRELTRNLDVTIEAWVDPGDNVDDAIDDICEQIENAMHLDRFFGCEAEDSILKSTSMEFIEESDRELGFVALTYDFTYRTKGYVEPPDADDYTTTGVKTNVANQVHPDEVAQDEFAMQ